MINSSPLITIYITNYNYGKYIQQAIESVLKQSFQDFEILIIDDGSTDNSKKIINQYLSYDKIKIIYQQNLGLTKSNNKALDLANGKYIMRLDADDILLENSLEIFINEFKKDSSLGMIFGNWYVIDEYNNIIFEQKRFDFENEVSLLDQPAHGACTMFKTEFLQELGGYDESLTRQDGYELWLRFIKRFKIKNVNQSIFKYRMHGENLTSNENKLLSTRSKILINHAKKYHELEKSVVIIPIRETYNKGIPFQKINNKTYLEHKIDFSLNCKNVSHVIISTIDPKIKDYISLKYNDKVEVYLRPKVYAHTTQPLQLTIDELLRESEVLLKSKYFFLLSVDLPLIEEFIINSSIGLMEIFNLHNIIGVKKEDTLYFKHSGHSLYCINNDFSGIQYEKEEVYTKIKGFNLINTKLYLESKKLFGDKIGHVMFDKISSLKVENEIDLKIVNCLQK
ncbi:MAG: Unknown protein [uncultured Sulfurovum sp.]|uniref:Glycosyltransferase 2-like domain-containing protein n=1 Tax=uncultured Sulfurovum sp. TaxID=269237 RepID=A0A6S6SYK1_9BACT|nr:MAG: Unknown protein [uncultured Sulfurovum sp.]